MKIPMMLTPQLAFHLTQQGIEPNDYKPAYNGESIGLDLFYAGENTICLEQACYDDGVVNTIKDHGNDTRRMKILLPTGVHIALPKGYVGLILDRGSISKTNLIRRAGVIDPGYTGEIFVNLIGSQIINPGDKLPVQLVVIKAESDYTVVTKEEFKELTSKANRQENKTGSSD